MLLSYRCLPTLRISCRHLSTKPRIPPVAPYEEWCDEVSSVAYHPRVFIKDAAVAKRVVQGFFPKTTKPKVVIEAFPGVGYLTRELLALPESKMSKLIVLEDVPEFLEHLKPLEGIDPRLKIVPLSGFAWSTYNEIEAMRLLDDVPVTDWQTGVPNLHFVAHIPNATVGDQLAAQLFRCIPEQQWLFKYGRMPMSLLMNELLWNRLNTSPSSKLRGKVGVIAEASSNCTLAIPSTDLLPEHLHPKPSGYSARNPGRRPGQPFAAINVTPLRQQYILPSTTDKWDFVLRNMFVLKSTSVKKALPSLAPGAINLVKVITDPSLPSKQRMDVEKKVGALTVDEWAILVKAFDEWAFAPQVLSVDGGFHRDIERD